LDEFEAKWGAKYPLGVKSWRATWTELSTMFKYPPEILLNYKETEKNEIRRDRA